MTPPVAQDRRRLPDEPRLRIGGMHLEELGHGRRRQPRVAGADARRGSIIAANSNLPGRPSLEPSAIALSLRHRRPRPQRVGRRGGAVHVAARREQAGAPARGRARRPRLRARRQAHRVGHAGRRGRDRHGAPRAAGDREREARRRRVQERERRHARHRDHAHAGALRAAAASCAISPPASRA